ncbi:MAG: serine/threonine-protein kinase [Ktedonobacteraceae bacterium]
MRDSGSLIGKTLGTCTLERLIGQGGMGVVYLAQQVRPSRRVAIKILLPHVLLDSKAHNEFLARFRREADVIARLEHINIMPIYEYGEQEEMAYLLMPYLAEGSLRDVLAKRGVLSLQETVRYIEQAASALDYAHAQGVIHRDLKPGNFLLHSDGRLILADFGIARMVQDSTNTMGQTLTGTGMFLGTPEYMAPEMVQGEAVDQRVDIYALGVVLFQLLSGQVPFKGNTPLAVAARHLQEPPPSLHQVNPAIPPSVSEVVQKALAKRREDRYPSAGALAQALRTAISAPDHFSDTVARNAPTALSSLPNALKIQAYETPPAQQQINQTTDRDRRDVYASGGTPLNAQPVTPYTVPGTKRQPWLIFIGVAMAIILVIGGVLVGLQLNKELPGTPLSNATRTVATHPAVGQTVTSTSQSTPTPAQQTATSTSQSTPTQQTAAIPKGQQLYFATSPGDACNHGGPWGDYNNAGMVCTNTGTKISNPNAKSATSNLVGTLLLSVPNRPYPSDYVIEVQLQQLSLSSSEFGVYFRNQSGNQPGVYTFLINPDGTWRCYVYDNVVGNPRELTRGPFGDIHASVTLDVVVSGHNFTFYANNRQLGSASDSSYSTGTAGIAVETGGSIFARNFALYALQ